MFVIEKPVNNTARFIVVMGATGCGKSTIARALAQRIKAEYIEGDDYHSLENKAKMSSGIPLEDADRWPWLATVANAMRQTSGRSVLSCSALKRVYRDYIYSIVAQPVLFVYLHGSREVLSARLANRQDHFMNTALLDSQLATLEQPGDDEYSITVNVDYKIPDILDSIEKELALRVLS